MSDSKKNQNDEISTAVEDAPEIMADEALEDVDGGYLKITMTNVQKAEIVGGAGVSPFAGNTITADSPKDVIDFQDGSDLVLRKRPGR